MGRRKLVGPFKVSKQSNYTYANEEGLKLEEARESVKLFISQHLGAGYQVVKVGAHLYTKQVAGESLSMSVKVYNSTGELVTNEILASA